MIIHRGIDGKTAFVLNKKGGMLAYIDEDIAKILDGLFGDKNGAWSIHSKQMRKDMEGTEFCIVQITDKDNDAHTIFFKINIVQRYNMTTKFTELFRQIRKDMPKPTKKIKSAKDRMREADMKKGRKNWKDDRDA